MTSSFSRMWNALACVAMAILIASCAETPLTFRFDPDTTAEERARFIRGAKKWDAHVLPDSHPVIAADGAWRVTFTTDIESNGRQVDGRACRVKKKDCPHALHLRIRRDSPAIRADEKRQVDISAHEFAHTMGLRHVNDPDGLNIDDPTAMMFGGKPRPPGVVPNGINATDLRECREAGRCGSTTTRSAPTECDL